MIILAEPMTREDLLLAHVEQLQQEIQQLKQENTDLQIALSTTVEHGDCIEEVLHQTNVKLQAEVVERKRAQSALQTLIDVVSQQRDDLEVIVETIMEHGDILDVQWRDKLHEVNTQAALDGLTQIPNRRRFDEHLQCQWQDMMGNRQPLSVILCDIDFFKQYNDCYGHPGGDLTLQRVAQALQSSLSRPQDMVARYGGEEFAAVLPETNAAGALRVAERMQRAIAQLGIPHGLSPISPHITLSIGIATLVPQAHKPIGLLIDQADQMLYRAKQQGRNQILVAPAGEIPSECSYTKG
jgi:diguanylate cyclase (GGDEF)-like protein